MKHLSHLLQINIIIISFIFSLATNAFSFFFDYQQQVINTSSGSVNYAVDNLLIDSNIHYQLPYHNFNLNTSQKIEFNIINNSLSIIDIEIYIEIAWHDDTLKEAGQFFLYPSNYDDETIYNNINQNNFQGAFFDNLISDDNNVYTSVGNKKGISKLISKQQFNPNNNYQGYQYNLFFYASAIVLTNLSQYANSFVDVNIITKGDIINRQTNWSSSHIYPFTNKLNANIGSVYFEEMNHARNYFITQANSLDLSTFIKAYDQDDNDISANMIITSTPTFNPNKAGEYRINYQVENAYGQLGETDIIIKIWDFIKTAAGTHHALALTSDGRVYSWGRNVDGQLGLNDKITRSVPTLISTLSNIIDIAVGLSSSYALDANGTVYSWGHNGYGHLGDGTLVTKYSPTRVSLPTDIKFINVAAHFNTAAAISESGDVYTWGYGDYGASGLGYASASNPTPTKISLTNIKDISFGLHGGAAISNDGKLYSWGMNTYGQLGQGLNSGNPLQAPMIVPYFNNIFVDKLDVGSFHMGVICDQGNVYTWGANFDGRLGTGNYDTASLPQKLNLPQKAEAIALSYSHSALICTDGVYLFGAGSYGKLGNKSTDGSNVPLLVENIIQPKFIALGSDNSFIYDYDRLKGSGNGEFSSLGNESNANIMEFESWHFAIPAPF